MGLHAITAELEQVQAEPLADYDIRVGGTRLVGREGAAVQMPRWAARVLAGDGLVRIEEPDIIRTLKQAVSLEIMADNLHAIDPGLYARTRHLMQGHPDRSQAEDLLAKLIRIRRGKLLLVADAPGPVPDGLADEEVEYFRAVRRAGQVLAG